MALKLRRIKFLVPSVWSLFILGILMCACNPGKQLNRMVGERKANPPEIVYPVQHIPTPDNINYIYDYEGLFSQAQQKTLDTLVRTFEKSNLIPIKLSTVNTAIAGPADSVGSYNKQALKDWDVVHGRSGKSVSVTISKSLGKVAVDYGDGVNRFLSTDDINTVFVDKYFPLVQQGDYYAAAYNTLSALMDAIRKNINFNPQPASR